MGTIAIKIQETSVDTSVLNSERYWNSQFLAAIEEGRYLEAQACARQLDLIQAENKVITKSTLNFWRDDAKRCLSDDNYNQWKEQANV